MNPARNTDAHDPGLLALILVEPGVYVRVLDLDYQAEQFEVFHRHASTRWTHYLCTQVIVAAFLLLGSFAAAGPVPLSVVAAGLLATWYVGMHRVVGAVAALQVGVLLLVTWVARDASALAPWHALVMLAAAALAQNLSHAVEPVPPTLTGRGFEPFPEYWRRATAWERIRLLLLNTLYAPMELVSAPRLFAVHVMRAMHRAGWNRAWAEDVARRADAILARKPGEAA